MKHNQAIMCGVIRDMPKILIAENGQSYAQFRLITINGNRTGGRQIESKAFDAPLIHTRNEALIEIIKKIKTGDIVAVKGAVTTALVTRRPKCEHCGERQTLPGLVAYISPASVTIIDKGIALDAEGKFDRDKATARLKEMKEISNVLTVVGVVCREPKPYKTDEKHKRKMTAYQIAIKRKLRIIGEMDDNTADFPWVKSYGKISMNDGLYIKKGTYMFIDGWFRARQFERHAVCEHCGEEVRWKDYSCDIVPYASEYIKNYNLPEEITDEQYKAYNYMREHVETEDSLNQDVSITQREKDEAEDILDSINNALKNTTDEIEKEQEEMAQNEHKPEKEVISVAQLKKKQQ